MKDVSQYTCQDDIVFPDRDFKLLIRSGAVSCRNSLESEAKVYHEEIEVKYFYEGNTTLRVGNDIIEAREGDIVVPNPYEFHATINVCGQECKYHCFMIGLDFFSDANRGVLDLRSLILEKQQEFKHCIRNNEYLGQRLVQVVKEAEEKKPYYKEAVRGLMQEFFAILLRDELYKAHIAAREGVGIHYYSIVEPALRKIRDDYSEKITIDALAELCNVSKCHFCRIFKLVTKMTAVQYITEYRFKVADLMLEYTDERISEIARKCGFADESYFCRYYKKVKGVSPYKNKSKMLAR